MSPQRFVLSVDTHMEPCNSHLQHRKTKAKQHGEFHTINQILGRRRKSNSLVQPEVFATSVVE